MANKVIIEIDVDEQGKASAALKSLEGDVLKLTGGVNRAGDSGVKLKDIFTGNLLADFFQRGASAALSFTAQTIQASAAGADANRVLEYSATRAGLSYARAGELAEEFGKKVGASNTEAARTFADILRLSERAGRAQEVDLISKRFADLSAARGIRGAELQNLIGTILSGQDEGLNRLGIDDPGKLNAAYAAQLGKTADALTQTEKARAALNAVLDKGAEAEGQAKERLAGTAGQLDSTRASVENLSTQVGDAVTNSVEFRDVLQTISDVLEGVITSHAKARAELAKGLKTPEQIAEEERNSFGRQAFNALKGGASLLFSAPLTLFDQLQLSTGQISLDEYNTRIAGSTEAAFNPGQRQYEARVAQLRELQEELKRQEAEATQRSKQLGAQDAESARRSTLQTGFNTRLSQALKGEDAGELRKLKQELQELGGVFDATDSNSLAKKIDDQLEQIKKKTVELARAARDSVLDLAQASAKENPFVKIFSDGDKAIANIREKFKPLGNEFVEQMVRMQQAVNAVDLSLARFDSNLTALKYRQEARRLRDPFIGLTGPQERELDVINKSIAQITQDPQLARYQQFLENPYRSYTAFDARRDLGAELNNLTGLDTIGAGRAGREAQARAILDLAKQIDPRILATSSDPTLRQLRFAAINATKVQREALQEDVRDSVERARAGSRIQQDAREQLKLLQASGLPQDEAIKRFLAITGTLSDKELTGDLRLGRERALDLAARRESAKEDEAAKIRSLLIGDKNSPGILQKLAGLIGVDGLKVDGSPVTVEVTDSSNQAKVSVLGPGYAPGFRS